MAHRAAACLGLQFISTPNIQYPTPNIQVKTHQLGRWMLGVGCWAFDSIFLQLPPRFRPPRWAGWLAYNLAFLSHFSVNENGDENAERLNAFTRNPLSSPFSFTDFHPDKLPIHFRPEPRVVGLFITLNLHPLPSGSAGDLELNLPASVRRQASPCLPCFQRTSCRPSPRQWNSQ